MCAYMEKKSTAQVGTALHGERESKHDVQHEHSLSYAHTLRGDTHQDSRAHDKKPDQRLAPKYVVEETQLP